MDHFGLIGPFDMTCKTILKTEKLRQLREIKRAKIALLFNLPKFWVVRVELRKMT
jgi:hypothetical protein